MLTTDLKTVPDCNWLQSSWTCIDGKKSSRRFLAGLRVCIWLGLIIFPATACWSADSADLNDADPVYELPNLDVGGSTATLSERDLLARPLTESPGLKTATSVVDQNDIERMHAYSVVDAMKYVPGAWTETRGRKVKSFFSVRGQRYPYPGYLIDGAWFREMHETHYYLGAANFERIEVLRSSSSLLWGPGGMTGMVNLTPKSYTQEETTVEGMGGTYNTLRGQVTHGTAGDNWNLGLGAGYYHTDGASDMNARENMTNLYARLHYRLSDDLSFSWSNFGLLGDRQLKLASFPASGTLQTRKDSFDPMKTYLTVGKLRYQPSEDNATELIGNYGSRRYDAQREPASGTATEWLEEDEEYGLSLIHSRKISSSNTLRGNLLFHRWMCPTGKRFYVGRPADIRTYSAAIVDDHDFGALDVSLGYRYSREHIAQFGGFNVEGSAGKLKSVEVQDQWDDPTHTVNLGASYELDAMWTLLGNVSWGQITAQNGMLDEDLQKPGAETRQKYDIGLQRDIAGLGQARVTGFLVLQEDAALVTNDTVEVDGVDYALYENGDRRNYGVEAEIQSLRFANGLQFFTNLTYMETRRTRDGVWETDEEIPNWLLGGGFSYLRGPWEGTLSVKHVASYQNQRFVASGDYATLGDYVTLDAQVTYAYQENTEIFVRVENLSDVEYSTVAGYPHDGTLVYAGFVQRIR